MQIGMPYGNSNIVGLRSAAIRDNSRGFLMVSHSDRSEQLRVVLAKLRR